MKRIFKAIYIAAAFIAGLSFAVNTYSQHNHGNENPADSVKNGTENYAVDPVCKIKVEKTDSLSVIYKDRLYYFCSEKDMRIFLKTPGKYITENKTEKTEEHSHGMMGMSTPVMIIMVSAMAVMMIAGMAAMMK